MSYVFKKEIVPPALILLLLSFLVISGGCDSGANHDTADPSEAAPQLPQLAVRTAETVAPRDTETPAIDGGYGFEQIADSLGFQTYSFTGDDPRFFGDPKAVKGGELVTTVPRFPATMRPVGQHANQMEHAILSSLMYESLLALHPVTFDYIPELASHWKISADNMTFWFRINPDARWSDGQPVTATDVLATWHLLMDETILMPSYKVAFGGLNPPQKNSKYIVSVTCNELSWTNFLDFAAQMRILPAHHISHLTGTEFLETYNLRPLPGSGPYTILEADIENQIAYSLTRRLDYWNGRDPMNRYRHNFDRIKFLVVKNNKSLEYEKFKKGETDFALIYKAQRWVEESDFPAVRKGWVQKRKMHNLLSNGSAGFSFNIRTWPFNDHRIREAFACLLDREKINTEIFYGQFDTCNSFYAGTIYENPNNPVVRYDPERAMALLAKAGFTHRNEEGWLVDDDGRTLRVTIRLVRITDSAVTVYQQMLKEYGIDLQIEVTDSNAHWHSVMSRDFSIAYGVWRNPPFAIPENNFSSELADLDNTYNIWGFKNARVDELIEEYGQSFDMERRVEIIREIDRIVAESHLMAWLYYRPDQRILYWNKFGYPDYMIGCYEESDRSIYSLWWLDPEKVVALNQAMATDTVLPIGKTEVAFWPDFVKNEDFSNIN